MVQTIILYIFRKEKKGYYKFRVRETVSNQKTKAIISNENTQDQIYRNILSVLEVLSESSKEQLRRDANAYLEA